MRLHELVEYLNGYLRVTAIPDYPGALNGLQVEGTRDVRRLGVAVDASEASVRVAVRSDCDLLLVHHGLFWDGNRPVTDRRYRRLQPLIASGVALYAAHLPLDLHPEVGNNAQLARELGIDLKGTFGAYQGVDVGVWGECEITREALAARLDDRLGVRVHLMPGGPERIRTIGVITGGGGSSIGEAIAAGLDAFITGEGAHHTYFDAVEGGINVYYGGHYATETFGVRALAAHLAERFGLEWEFFDLPTGL
ncbi:MAG TPA: Nif3-like dinuclear metal center hexameric protein [Longimicrobiales bacterium]|nr:Nif3-like dinuclear metal center hexameric protein [Longimicrobiales bacterium]